MSAIGALHADAGARWRAWVLSAASGALLNCAFAPLGWWPLAIACPALVLWLWEGATPRYAAQSGFAFGFGLISVGTWWLYVSIRTIGQTPLWLTGLLLLAMWCVIAAYYGLLGYLAVRFLPRSGPWRWLVGLPALWVLLEWLRGWFLSGFPWLSLGYSQTDTWLAGFGPVVGVYGLSALLAVGAGALVALVRGGSRPLALAALLVPWLLGAALTRVEWTQPSGEPLSVAVLQGAVAESVKWDPAVSEPTRRLYRSLNDQALGARLIVWPESAVPDYVNEIPDYLSQVLNSSRTHGSDVVMGILRIDDNDQAYDSIMALSDHIAFYDKHHLVPFAEFFPVPAFVRAWMRLRNLPNSDFARGSAEQPPLAAAGTLLAPTICYEDGFGSQNLQVLRRARALVNVTNDGWFGHSWARYQHLQISRMRALEARRPLVRAANDGVSALIGAHGEVLAQAPEFEPAVLRGRIQPRAGLVPYAWLHGNYLIVMLALAGVLVAAWRRGHR